MIDNHAARPTWRSLPENCVAWISFGQETATRLVASVWGDVYVRVLP
jgi:hypothetical protein